MTEKIIKHSSLQMLDNSIGYSVLFLSARQETSNKTQKRVDAFMLVQRNLLHRCGPTSRNTEVDFLGAMALV